MNCAGYSAMIDRLFVAGLGQAELAELRRHLAACAACRERYDRVVRLDTALSAPAGEVFSAQHLASLAPALLQAVAARPSRRQRLSAWMARAHPTLVAALLATLVVLVGLSTLWPQGPRPQGGELQARGAELTARPGAGVRAYCIRLGDSGPLLHTIQPGLPAACRLDDLLQFSYTNSAGERPYRHLFLFGLDERGTAYWYHPTPGDKLSVSLSAGPEAVDRPLPGAIALRVNHHPGPLRVLALFSDDPISVTEVERLLDESRARELPLAADFLEAVLGAHLVELDMTIAGVAAAP